MKIKALFSSFKKIQFQEKEVINKLYKVQILTNKYFKSNLNKKKFYLFKKSHQA